MKKNAGRRMVETTRHLNLSGIVGRHHRHVDLLCRLFNLLCGLAELLHRLAGHSLGNRQVDRAYSAQLVSAQLACSADETKRGAPVCDRAQLKHQRRLPSCRSPKLGVVALHSSHIARILPPNRVSAVALWCGALGLAFRAAGRMSMWQTLQHRPSQRVAERISDRQRPHCTTCRGRSD
jgi:hypothetical protein